MPETGLTIAFDVERETKNTVRYAERGADIGAGIGAIGTLYVQKDALRELAGAGQDYPAELELTIRVPA